MARKSTQKPSDAVGPPLFDAMLAAAGHVVPPDRRAGLIAACDDVRKQAARLREEPIAADLEPSNVFSLVPYTLHRAEEV
jgi:hypothetical protein